ncbi:MAG: helix-turn-helix transcriptional regulator [Rhodoferax sp.]|uniref:helix-turn-helix transcriptional regulator n=1 Tax=Rhodoferax sp. TaxID=50421 RepID=UPI0017AD110B|nr:helix-turn-helix transcriptional regulator [Rhodoferax sp.]NMM13871.1 helix-turn-helix transcriptional regulator [Rhodoferax sp.]
MDAENLPTVTFGYALNAERKRLGITQGQLAERTNTTQQNVAGLESDKSLPRPELFSKIIEVFGRDSILATLPSTRRILMIAPEINHVKSSQELQLRPIQQAALDALATALTDGRVSDAECVKLLSQFVV